MRPSRMLPRPGFRPSPGGSARDGICTMALLLATASWAVQAQEPPPLPQPKPIQVAPMPRPGQASARPRPTQEPAESKQPKTAKPEAISVPRPTETAARSTPEPSYGATPVPWPKGSADPAHFPKEIPRFPGARQASFSMSFQVATVFFCIDGPPEEVARFYGAFLAREKWVPLPIPGPPLEADRILIAEKGDWTLRVDASRNPLSGATEVFLTAALKPLPPVPKPAAKPEGKFP